jgi:Carboxypeptidase regulatory-like domain
MIGCQRRAFWRAFLFRHVYSGRRPSTHRVVLTVPSCWIRFGKEFAIGSLMLVLASGSCLAASTAAVSGVVRDAQGVAQMGAMVQVLAAGSVSVATAFTDMNGRYRIANLVPGSYQVRATAALFVPATRRNLQLLMGMRATVNLTLTMLSEPAAWLPAQRRKADEPGDDWTWTLRSVADRPILRMLGDGEIVPVAAGETSRRAAIQKHASLMSGEGFGEGGYHAVVAMNRTGDSGSDMIVRTDVADGVMFGSGNRPAAEVDAGYQSAAGFTGSSRLVMSFVSHPEMVSGGNASGMQMTRMSSARKMQLGDSVDVEAGGTVYAIHTAGTALTAKPFLRVTVRPGEVWAVRYQLATSRDLQGYDGMDSIAADLPIAAMCGGRLTTEHGTHQEIAVSRKAGNGVVQAAVYHDTVVHPEVAGIGAMSVADMVAGAGTSDVVVDTATDTFRFLGAGYSTNGISVAVSEPLTQSLWATLEYDRGSALAVSSTNSMGLAEAGASLHAEDAGALTAALKAQVQRTGTRVRAAYRWQPEHTVTAVDPYAALSDQGYLSFYVRQAVRWGDRLPTGLEATIDVTNLLAEGYQPFLSADGHTLFLAQAPRTIQAGLAFTF